MYCNKCGKQLADGSIFCNYCGVKIEIQNEDIESKTQDDIIISACKDCIMKHIKAPATVQFSIIEIQDRDAYGRIYLYAEIDAQNAFGAMLRNKLRVVLQSVNDHGQAVGDLGGFGVGILTETVGVAGCEGEGGEHRHHGQQDGQILLEILLHRVIPP